uniref:Uncharacterized protein n=1 Tax=Glossina morsitans morsitans TaxID=37546 RepID=A0A1B0FJS6_GLOMM
MSILSTFGMLSILGMSSIIGMISILDMLSIIGMLSISSILGVPVPSVLSVSASFYLVFFCESVNVCHQGLLETLQRSLADVTTLPKRVQGEKFFRLGTTTVQTLLQLQDDFKQWANFKRFLLTAEWNFPEDKDLTICYEALQSIIAMSAYHITPEVQDEAPDELFELN